MPPESPLRAGFLGLGAMGWPMADHLAQRQLLSAVHNRTGARADQFTLGHQGVRKCAQPEQLLESADVVFLCISADADVLQVVQQMQNALQPGQVIIDCSTVSPATAKAAARLVESCGATFLDAPVTGGVEGARQGTLSVMAGGPSTTVDRCRPLFDAFSIRLIHMGTTGAGQAAKAVNQVMCAGINEAVTEALAFARQLELDLPKTIDAIRGGAAGNWFLEKRGLTMTQGTYAPGFKLGLHLKDLAICLEMAEALGTRLPLTEMTHIHYAQLVAQGHADEDISALYRLKEPAS